ncbi:MAG: DegT/DnrJ/EryC1/StrS family aminotransferase [Pseudomonadota bacterium]|nr:DegT/DnrJ/EryC1/StrS family aminotransferase [Pseudomonadota bacterium]
MTVFKYPLATSSWDENEIRALEAVIASGQFSMGELVKRFEEEFASYFRSKYAVMVNSGSSANLLLVAALRYTQNELLKLERGDEVIVPAVSWSTTYFPLHQYGLKLKFVDIDRHSLNFDLNALTNAITNETKAIMAVNLLGNPNDFHVLNELIEKNSIILLEDNCESMGAKFNGKYTGSFGVMGSFSFFFSHHISTMEGGMVLTDDEELYHIMLSLRSHGWTRQLPLNNKLTTKNNRDPFHNSFDFILPGYNLRPLEMSGAIGTQQLKKFPKFLVKRTENATHFVDIMQCHEKFTIQKEIGQSSWFGFSLLLREPWQGERASVIQKLNHLGFECRPIVAGNFLNNSVINHLNYTVHDELKNADYVEENGLFIGNHHFCMKEAIDHLQKL